MKRSNYKSILTRCISLFLAAIILLSTNINVYASTLTIENVSKQFDQSNTVQILNQLGSSMTSKVNSSDKTLDIYEGDEKAFSFTYTDDYIEYDNRDTSVTEENLSNNLGAAILITGVIESVFALSGYDGKTLSEDAPLNDTFSDYGLQLETEKYNFSNTSEDGATSESSGEFIKYFKISLDTDKIDSLVTKYGVDVQEQDPSEVDYTNLIPTIKAENITNNSVTIYPKVDYNNEIDAEISCYIYRSIKEDGKYERISDWAVNCLDSVGITDDDLKSNTTYYYKALVKGGSTYSRPLKVTTKRATENSVVENPKTGISSPIVKTTVLLIGCICAMVYIKKKSVFKRL